MGERGWGPHVHDIHISSLAQGFLVTLALCSSLLGAHLGVFGHVLVFTMVWPWSWERNDFWSTSHYAGLS